MNFSWVSSEISGLDQKSGFGVFLVMGEPGKVGAFVEAKLVIVDVGKKGGRRFKPPWRRR